jgi:leucyl-tRNA synthetase
MVNNYNFKTVEKKWQTKWQKEKIFEPKIDNKKPKFFFTTPFPYISGSLHIGHGRAATEGDVYCRYKRMAGFNVLFPLAFHITGTPVLGFATSIKNKNPKMMKIYREYLKNYFSDEKKLEATLKSFEDPWNIVKFFAPKMMDEYNSLGLGIDWSRRFTTGDEDYQKFIEWQFLQYQKKNYIEKGNYPVLFCINCNNAVGEDDIKDGDTDSVEKQEFTLLKFYFPEAGKNTFLVAATLRPETVYGQTNLWVNPNTEYLRVKVDNEFWIISKPAKEKLSYQKDDIQTVDTFLGDKLIGKYCTAPGIKRRIPIYPSFFVSADVGSGIVTSVPSDAPYDYIALQDLKKNTKLMSKYNLNREEILTMRPIPIINSKEWGDQPAVKIVEQMNIKDQEDSRLKEATQKIYRAGFHTGFLKKNCGEYAGKSVAEAKDLVKNDLIKNKQASILYETSRPAQCRCGGTVIVAILDGQWFLNFNAGDWKDKAYSCLEQIEIWPPVFRKQFKDTFEWLDKRPCARRRGIGTKLPFDKNWIIESLSDSTMYMTLYTIKNLINKYKIKPEQMKPEFFDYIFLGKTLPKNSKLPTKTLDKLKQSFEYWYPNDHRHTYPAHLSNHLSFFIFAHAGILNKKYWPKKITLHGMVMSEGQKMAKSKGNIISILDIKNKNGADLFRSYMCTSSNINGEFNWSKHEAEVMTNKLNTLYTTLSNIIKTRKSGKPKSDWFISHFQKHIIKATESLNEMNLRDYAQVVFYEIYNNYIYLNNRAKKDEVAKVNNEIAEAWIKMLAPLIPHIAEELWSELGKKNFVSIADWPEADKKKINDKAEKEEALLQKTAEDIQHICKIVGKDAIKKICLYVIPPECKQYEGCMEFLINKFKADVSVFAINDKTKFDPQGKAKKAKPGRPAIYLE